jgi:hypothetical protein
MEINIMDNGKIIYSTEKECFIALIKKQRRLMYGKKEKNGLL